MLFIWLSFSIYRQLERQPDLEKHTRQILYSLQGPQSWKLWLILLLMLVNWGIEARKWQVLIRLLEPISFWRSFRAIFSGVAFALNTPNRIGEYAGRLFYITAPNRIRSVSLTIVGSFSQLIVTLFFGTTGLFFLSPRLITYYEAESFSIWLKLLLGVLVVLSLGCGLIFFRISWLIKGVERLPGLSNWIRHIAVIEEMNVTILLRVIGLSFVRSLVFVLQYTLLLQLMKVEVSWWTGFWTVNVLFLLLAIWPTIALLELGLRWEYSLVLFKLYSENTVGIYATATGIWLINLVLPAIAGSLFFLGLRIYQKRSGNQNMDLNV